MSLQLIHKKENRKYPLKQEHVRFERVAKVSEWENRTYCQLLLYTACKISEALGLMLDNLDFSAKAAVYHPLKKRGSKIVYYVVLLLDSFLDELNLILNLKAWGEKKESVGENVWPWACATASYEEKEVIQRDIIIGIQASLKGLRHRFESTDMRKMFPEHCIGMAEILKHLHHRYLCQRYKRGRAEHRCPSWN